MKLSPTDPRDTVCRSPLLRVALAACAALVVSAAVASPPARFARGDPGLSQPLNEKDCVACDARRFDGDAGRNYTRNEHRGLRAPAQLLAQVSYCTAELGTGYFPEEEEHIAAYLNKRHYRFE